MRAKNAEGTSDWSNPGVGTTNLAGANNAPVFSEGAKCRAQRECKHAPAGRYIGLPVTATDADAGDRLTYSLEGRDAGLFDIDDTDGQLRTRSGITI